jgi:D-alanyl-D-alanine carboxypeptidase
MNSPWVGPLKVDARLPKRAYLLLGELLLGVLSLVALSTVLFSTVHVDPAAAATSVVIRPLTVAEQIAMRGVVWKPGCPVALGDLRRVESDMLSPDGSTYRGALVVHRSVASAVGRIMVRLYAVRFPVRSMKPIEAFRGDDDLSTRADNSSAFNCRTVEGRATLSEHAFGRAIDLNPVENPYVRADGTVLDPAAARFVDRSAVGDDPAAISADGPVVRIFRAEGWGWGGSFKKARDYQHFSTSGR